MNTTTARGRAIAAQEAGIQSNIAKIEDAKRPSALEAMAMRLNVSAGTLTDTLKQTVFKGSSNAEFVALVVVSNAYGLNPLLKEIYAFPAKGGGIIPYVSVDGWNRIINEHPMFDGIEFNDIIDENGQLYAIESVIYRRDRSRPIKVTEYMDECKGAGPAWQKTPKRMLRHRSLIQGARIAFGFSGIYAEGDEPAHIVQQDGGERARPVPSRRETIHAETGEFTQADDDVTAELDRQAFREIDGDSDFREGRPDTDMGETQTDSPAATKAADLIASLNTATTLDAIGAVMREADADLRAMDEDIARTVYAARNEANERVKGGVR